MSSEHSDQNLDYGERSSVADVHSAVKREKEEPKAGLEPVSIWAFIVAALVLVLGGTYLGAYTQFGDLNSVYAEPNYTPDPRPVSADLVVEDVAWIDMWMKRGKSTYGTSCGGCHNTDGSGQPANQFPPLAGAEWVTGGTERIGQIVMSGLHGPITVKGQNFGGQVMPPQSLLSDEQLAQTITYVRRSFGNDASVVTTEMMAAAREKYASRTTPWTVAELAAEDQMLPGAEVNLETGEPVGSGAPAPAAAGETN